MNTDPVQRASDPATPLEELQFLAQNHPSLRPLIAENPSTYPALLEWLSEFSDPEIAAALQRRQNRINRAARREATFVSKDAEGAQLRPGKSAQPPQTPQSAASPANFAPRSHRAHASGDTPEPTAAIPPQETEVAIGKVSPEPAASSPKAKFPAVTEADASASPKTAATEKTKAEKLKLADEADLEEFSPQEEKTASKKSKIFVIIVAVLIGLVLSIGGNLADRLTGGDGSKSWYGKNGVIARIFGDSDLNKDRNNNGIPDAQENGAANNKNGNSAGKAGKNSKNNAGAQLDVKTEGRQIAPAPTSAIGEAKGLPDGAYQVSEFSLPDAPIKCTIGSEVVCTAFSFTGNIGQDPGATVRFTLGAAGVKNPEDLGVKDRETSQTILASGAAAASGAYACQSSGSGVDCWNLQTGYGLKLTINSAEAYQPKTKSN
ncbi:hypothetical protein [uncultured Varibaculum sp.]|uniref:variant leucine-rich repeat-containing protein n=1 Tax=uncultured Varibaculum sp. TaxID=413896 RepID=UPI0025918604|nr:hypothetical protein [uncultured Varibaculum sp.]